MNLLCLIDNLGSGGAQRQMTALAVGLKKRGHDVRFLVYHPDDHFLPLLQAADIPCELIPPCLHGRRLLAIRRVLRQGWQDVVLAFLEGPCLYAELSGLPWRRWGLVAGERLADPRILSRSGRWLRQFHRLADAVVCNSHTNRLMLEAVLPCLTDKLSTIYNTVDLELFRGGVSGSRSSSELGSEPFRIVVAASYQEKKNMMGVAQALLRLQNTPCPRQIVVDWYGAVPTDAIHHAEVERFIAHHDLSGILRLHSSIARIEREFASASAVGLFSFYEGLPNVICEAMACGRPILLSRVCDAGRLVVDGKNGFLCDPGSPDDMAEKMLQMASLDEGERQRMGVESRRKAEELFAESVLLDSYEGILARSARVVP